MTGGKWLARWRTLVCAFRAHDWLPSPMAGCDIACVQCGRCGVYDHEED